MSGEAGDHDLLRASLAPARCSVVAVSSCGEAAEAVERDRPDLVVCDHMLPDGSWKDILWLLSEHRDPPPVIVISRLADEYLWAEVLNHGGFDVLSKPLEPFEILRLFEFVRQRTSEK